MPWKESRVVEERAKFVFDHARDVYTMTELCQIYGVSRETGYEWLRRYREGWGERIGLLPVDDRSFTLYFAAFPIARFDSRRLKVLPLLEREDSHEDEAREGDGSPSPAPHPLTQAE